MTIVRIDGGLIKDWDSFHDLFAAALGFPDYYGRNMDAWVDCMTYIDDSSAGMTRVHVGKGSVLTVQIDNIDSFSYRCPEQYAALVESAAFVNWRRLEAGQDTVLALSFNMSP